MYELNIKEIRLSKELKQYELANLLGISKSFLSYLENNKSDIKLSLLYKISIVLEVEPFKLVKFRKNKKRSKKTNPQTLILSLYILLNSFYDLLF